MRIHIDEGVYIDFYNVHADAGCVKILLDCVIVWADWIDSNTKADLNARNSNLQQVANHIESHSMGNAVVVTGDTNSLYASPGENIRVFKDQNLMKDSWVELMLNGVEPREGSQPKTCDNPTTNNTCEVLDKILYDLVIFFFISWSADWIYLVIVVVV